MTTDTRPKHAWIDMGTYSIGGVIKGAGMINPSVATMLSLVFTDAAIPQPLLQRALAATAQDTYNAATIDGDTSTNDTVLAFSNGASSAKVPFANAVFCVSLSSWSHSLRLD